MKATCPTDASHNRFITVAHVTEDWIVDEYGAYIGKADSSGETVHGPNPGNTWYCETCGTEAKVTT